MRKLLLAAGFVFALAIPAQAQPLVTVSCSSVFIDFRTSIQPDSATVQIDSNAGTETHSVNLAQGGTDPRTFPLDGQSGEVVTVNVTLVHAGIPNTVSASETLEGCAEPSPSPSPTVSPEPSPSPIATADAPAVSPGASPSPEPPAVEEEAGAAVETRSESAEELPAELAYTGFSQILGLLILAGSLICLGFYARGKGYRRAR